MLLPTLATLNNLSFYPIILCPEIYADLKHFVSSPDELVSVEAIRVMGNLSRRREIRAKLSEDDFLREIFDVVKEADNKNRDICFSCKTNLRALCRNLCETFLPRCRDYREHDDGLKVPPLLQDPKRPSNLPADAE